MKLYDRWRVTVHPALWVPTQENIWSENFDVDKICVQLKRQKDAVFVGKSAVGLSGKLSIVLRAGVAGSYG